MIHVTLSGDIFLKSRRTQPRMIKRVLANLSAALATAGYDGELQRLGSHRFALDPGPDAEPVTAAAARVFGVASVDIVEEVAADDLGVLASAVADATDRPPGRSIRP